MRHWLPLFLLAGALASPLLAQTPAPTTGSPWVLVPPFFARGALISLLSGNPNEPGPLHVQLSYPKGYRMRPHYHAAALHITVLRGALRVGLGERFDLKKTQVAGIGDTATVPAGQRYYYVAEEWTILDVTTTGPFRLVYVRPEDDPSQSRPFGH